MLKRLIETYDACAGHTEFADLPLIAHTPQQAHIEIVIDAGGNFKTARNVEKESTLVAATEASAGRTSKPTAHPLCDKLQYVAKDIAAHGSKSYFDLYFEQLDAWCASPEHSHPKARAVRDYVRRGTVAADLICTGILHVDQSGRLLARWTAPGKKPPIFGALTPKPGGEYEQGGALVRWVVEGSDDDEPTEVWLDRSLQNSWIAYNAASMGAGELGVCLVTGEREPLARNHPKRIRHALDGAKLISANDQSGYTYRGRFTDASGEQAFGMGYTASQKAHIALRWLIERPGHAARNGDQVFVAWETSGKDIPGPATRLSDTNEDEGDDYDELASAPELLSAYSASDLGEAYASALRKKINGYRANLPESSRVVFLGIDSAVPGRLAITYSREFGGDEYLKRIERWHLRCAWLWEPRKAGERILARAPTLPEIVEAAYGPNADDKLRKAATERLMACIVDGRPLPGDLVASAVRRVARPRASETSYGQWLKWLQTACALYRASRWVEGKEYKLALETNRITRDYLYGRMLALADAIESQALRQGGDTDQRRDTSALRLMQRFADHPYPTWLQIEDALTPYKVQLRNRKRSDWLERQLDDVLALFESPEEFMRRDRLSGEFLLGYHCQRHALKFRPDGNADGRSDAAGTDSETIISTDN